MDERTLPGDDLEARLRALGEVAVEPAVADRHLAAMAQVSAQVSPASARRFRFGWKAVAAAGMVGFLAGSTGLAAAGSLPGGAQDVAHDVLGAVGIDVPRSTEGCPEGATYRNHGEYVSEVEAAGGDVETAAHSDCGKPLGGGGRGHGNGANDGAGRVDRDGDPCTGPPPWAGAHVSAEARAAMQAEHAAQCGTDATDADADADDDGDEVEERDDEAPEETTTTVSVPDETTTTVSAPEETTTTTIG